MSQGEQGVRSLLAPSKIPNEANPESERYHSPYASPNWEVSLTAAQITEHQGFMLHHVPTPSSSPQPHSSLKRPCVNGSHYDMGELLILLLQRGHLTLGPLQRNCAREERADERVCV